MLSKIVGLVFCVSCVFAGSKVHYRAVRSPSGSSSGSSSYSSSSSSSSGSGAPGGFFSFPTPMPYFQNPSPIAFPMYDVNQMFQQFLSTAQAAHSYAAQNPAYAKVFQQQMSMLASLQKMAMVQYPFAFPGFDLSNSLAPEIYGQDQAGGWGGAPLGGYGSVGGSSGSGSYGGAPGGGGAGGYRGGFGTGSDPSVFTSGSVSVGPGGGYLQASASPGGPDGLGVRISEELPALGGSSFGTFSSSSSGVSNINGKTTSFKTSSVGINDNGKITFRTVSE